MKGVGLSTRSSFPLSPVVGEVSLGSGEVSLGIDLLRGEGASRSPVGCGVGKPCATGRVEIGAS